MGKTKTNFWMKKGWLLISYSVGALTEDGNLYTWGRNDRGQLGINSNTFTTVPILVVFPKNKKIKDFALGWNHSLAVSSNFEIHFEKDLKLDW